MGMSPTLMRPRNAFTPKSIAGLKLWLDATVLSSLTFNGSSVSQWNDLSGNGFNATQGTGANQPSYSATGMNGLPSLEFTTSASSLMNSTAKISDVFGTPDSSPQSTIFAVMRDPSGGGDCTFGSNSDANGRLVYVIRFGAGDTVFFDCVNATDGRLSTTLTQSQAESPGIHTLIRTGASQTIRHNGKQLATKTTAISNFTATTSTIQIGKAVGSVGGSGVFSALIFYNRSLNSTEIAAVEKYLSSKFGIAT